MLNVKRFKSLKGLKLWNFFVHFKYLLPAALLLNGCRIEAYAESEANRQQRIAGRFVDYFMRLTAPK